MHTSSKNSSVIDANVWLALISSHHIHYESTVRWYETLAEGEAGLCRVVQLSVLRLMGNRSIVGPGVISASQAWIGLEQLLEDQRVEYLEEPFGLTPIWPTLLRYKEPTPNLINDSYLAAFAIAGGHKLVTRDRGFLEFRGLDVEILGD